MRNNKEEVQMAVCDHTNKKFKATIGVPSGGRHLKINEHIDMELSRWGRATEAIVSEITPHVDEGKHCVCIRNEVLAMTFSAVSTDVVIESF
jgi:hypothetical protein